MKHIFIVNPTSGNGQYLDIIEQIKTVFSKRDDYEIILTEYPGHAEIIAAQYDHHNRIYAVGGDGTANEVLNGLQDGVSLGLIPAGSGNDFLRNMLPKLDLKTIITDLLDGDISQIDYALFNGRKQLNSATAGFDAEVNHNVNLSKIQFLPRKSLYALFALKGLFFKKTVKITINHDGQRKTFDVLLASIMNGKFYGGGFKAAPNANLQDGLLDVTLIENVSRLRILYLFPVYYKGKHLGIDVVTNFQTSRVTVESDHPIRVGCDGELSELKEFTIEVVPSGLSLIVPQGYSIQGQ